jgi:hypothetical protein
MMARGWESKSVEEQQAESVMGRPLPRPLLTPDQLLRENREKDLKLTKTHVAQQLQQAQNPRYRTILQDALAALDAKLAALG